MQPLSMNVLVRRFGWWLISGPLCDNVVEWLKVRHGSLVERRGHIGEFVAAVRGVSLESSEETRPTIVDAGFLGALVQAERRLVFADIFTLSSLQRMPLEHRSRKHPARQMPPSALRVAATVVTSMSQSASTRRQP